MTNLLATASKDGTICLWETRNWQLLTTLYNLKEGFLCTTPPEEVDKSGWFWTDRPELIKIIKCNEDGSDAEDLEGDSEEGKGYIELYNRQDMVMNRLNNYKQYEHDLARILNRSEIKRIEMNISSRTLRLPIGKKK